MKTAVVCPIGHLDRMGYQNVAEPCVDSMAEFGDWVYLVQSMRDAAEWWDTRRWEGIQVIADQRTFMARNVDGGERFNSMRIL